MSTPANVLLAPRPAAGVVATLRGAAKRLTGRVLGITLAIALALEAWLVMDALFEWGPRIALTEVFLSASLVNLLMVFAIMFATLVADQRVAAGAERIPAYAWAVMIGAALAAFAQWQAHQWLGLHLRNDVPGTPQELLVTQPFAVFFEYLIWGWITVFIYVNRRNALLATTRLNRAQVQRAETQRRTLESRLQVMQARVEPQFLFNTLARVGELYESDAAKAGAMLGTLIVYLRAALPHLRESTSNLQQEIALAGAYFNIFGMQQGMPLGIGTDVPPALRAARLPPMVLLPLIEVLLARRAPPKQVATLRIVASTAHGVLRIEISDSAAARAAVDDDGRLHDIRARLHALYGARWSLNLEARAAADTRAVLEIPHEPSDGSHR